MSKFTPGKWKIDMSSTVSYECPHIFIYPEDLEVKQINEDVHIALVNAKYDECTTNAELIAAAPEMYELLRRCALFQPVSTNEIWEVLDRIDGTEEAEA